MRLRMRRNNIIQSKAVMNLNQTSEGVFMSRTAPLVRTLNE